MSYLINPWRYISANGCPIPLNLLITNETQFTADFSWGTIKALGGTTSIIQDGSNFYAVHEFTSNENFQVLETIDVEYLVVAGGGAGGVASTNSGTGGGGAGGLLTNIGSTALTLTADTYSISVGGGGTSASPTGQNSAIGTIIVTDGGGRGGFGGTTTDREGGDGGSGGGGSGTFSSTNFAGGTATVGQGNDGGDAQSSTSSADLQAGGGGGGASAVGANASSGNAGNGGDGLQSSINGTATYYAGGGGGGKRTAVGTTGTGGLGGGGNGAAVSDAAGNGVANTGGGGGGCGPTGTAGDGGSGIVIIRYQIDEPGDFELELFLSGGTTAVDTATVLENNSYTITGLTHSTAYEARVRTICSGGVYSDWSDKEGFTTTAFEAPTNLTAAPTFFDSVLSWTGSGIEDQWQLEYGLNGYVTPIEVITANTTSYTITGLTTGTTYEWKVNGLKNGQLSLDPTPDTFTTLSPPLPNVTNLTAGVAAESVALTWTGNGYTGEEYEVEWGLSGYSVAISSTTTSNEFLNISNLTSGTTYEFNVVAKLGGLESGAETVFATPQFTTFIYFSRTNQVPYYIQKYDYTTGDALSEGVWPLTVSEASTAGTILPNNDLYFNYSIINDTIYSNFGDIKAQSSNFSGILQTRIAVDDNNNLYNGQATNIVRKLNSSGTIIWSTTIQPSVSDSVRNTALSVDHSKVIYNWGDHTANEYGWGILDAASGTTILDITGVTASYNDVVVDSNDRIIFAGNRDSGVANQGPLEIYDGTTGALISGVTSGTTSKCVAVDTNDNIIYDEYGSIITRDIVKINSAGAEQFRITIGSYAAYQLNNIFTGFDDGFIIVIRALIGDTNINIRKYNSSGTLLYTISVPNTSIGQTNLQPAITPLPISRY